MKLLFVGTSRGGGGTESHFITLAKAMRQEGHEVAAVVSPGSPIHQGLLGSGVRLYTGIFRNAFDPRGIGAVWRAIGVFNPDWIIGSFSKEYWPLAVISKMRGVKLALFRHMTFPLKPVTHYFIPRLADRFIVISNYVRENFIARGINPARIQMLYNPLDLDYFRPDPVLRKASREKFGFDENDIVIGFIGALHPHKGIFTLAESLDLAMAEMPKLKALWVGEGPAEPDLRERIRNGKFASSHICHRWAQDVRPYYAAMDMLAIPSIANEAFGRVSLEAQACAIPVLCSSNGGLPETLQPGTTGLLLPPGDVVAWGAAVLNLARDTQLRTRLQSRGRDWVAITFSTAAIAKQFAHLLEQPQ